MSASWPIVKHYEASWPITKCNDMSSGMPLDFCENNWTSTCACCLRKLTQKKTESSEREDEIGERIGPKITENQHPCVIKIHDIQNIKTNHKNDSFMKYHMPTDTIRATTLPSLPSRMSPCKKLLRVYEHCAGTCEMTCIHVYILAWIDQFLMFCTTTPQMAFTACIV